MPEFLTDFSPEGLAAVAGMLMSLVFSYVPGLSTKFGALQEEVKRSIMLGLVVLIGAASYGLSCTEYFSWFTCDETGLIKLVTVIFTAAASNYITFKFSPNSKSRVE